MYVCECVWWLEREQWSAFHILLTNNFFFMFTIFLFVCVSTTANVSVFLGYSDNWAISFLFFSSLYLTPSIIHILSLFFRLYLLSLCLLVILVCLSVCLFIHCSEANFSVLLSPSLYLVSSFPPFA